jgi:glucose-1-phosphate thymidylyltransferase
MKAIILAAGYATRLRPLTDTVAKPLLPVGGRPMVDWICDKVDAVDDVDEIHVVTNARYAASFEEWARTRPNVQVHDDGTTSNDDRLGAIGDTKFVIDEAGIDDDLLVIAGDNLFDFDVADYVSWWRTKGEASAVTLYDVGDLELVKLYSVVEVDEDERIVSFEEKPQSPPTTLVATATYLYHRAHLPLVERYLAEGNPPDQPGNLVAWLHPRVPVYGYRFPGGWYDVGNAEQLLEADNRLRERAGLPARDTYSLQS